MDINRAKDIVATLAEGIDPITGEVLASDHVCNNAEVVRAFYTVLAQVDVAAKKELSRKRRETLDERGRRSLVKLSRSRYDDERNW